MYIESFVMDNNMSCIVKVCMKNCYYPSNIKLTTRYHKATKYEVNTAFYSERQDSCRSARTLDMFILLHSLLLIFMCGRTF